jgi:hypothetical protein
MISMTRLKKTLHLTSSRPHSSTHVLAYNSQETSKPHLQAACQGLKKTSTYFVNTRQNFQNV